MLNPFLPQGQAHKPSLWHAPVGFLANPQLITTTTEGVALALIGDIGTGKTEALRAYRAHTATSALLLEFNLNDYDSGEELERLHQDIYWRLLSQLSEFAPSAANAAAARVGLNLRGAGAPLDRRQHFEMIGALTVAAKKEGRPVSVLLDECQRPMEMYESLDPQKLMTWFERLKRLSEVITHAGGRLVITATPSPWRQVPQKTEDRFTVILAHLLSLAEIEIFALSGLKQVSDGPQQLENGFGEAVLHRLDEQSSLRRLHVCLHDAWEACVAEGRGVLCAHHLR